MLYYGLLLFFFFEYFRPGSYLPFLNVLHANSLIPLFVFVFTMASRKYLSNAELLKKQNTKLMIIYLFLILISIATADVTLYAYDTFKAVLGYFLIYIIMVKLLDNINKIKSVFILLILIHILLAILNPDIVLDPSVRSYLTGVTFLGDGNDYSLSVCITIPFCIFLIGEFKNKNLKIFFIAILILMVLCVIGTQSRGGSIALASIFAYQWFKSKNKFIGIVLVIALLAIVLAFAPPEYLNRMNTMKEYQTEGSAQGRIKAWKAAINMASDHPFLGVGAGHFPFKYGRLYQTEGSRRNITAHSIYFLVLGELGYPGLLFLISIIYVNLRSNENDLKEIRNHDPPLFQTHQKLLICLKTSMIGYAVGGAFLSALYYPHIYVLAALFAARHFIVEKATRELIFTKKDIKLMNDLYEEVPP